MVRSHSWNVLNLVNYCSMKCAFHVKFKKKAHLVPNIRIRDPFYGPQKMQRLCRESKKSPNAPHRPGTCPSSRAASIAAVAAFYTAPEPPTPASTRAGQVPQQRWQSQTSNNITERGRWVGIHMLKYSQYNTIRQSLIHLLASVSCDRYLSVSCCLQEKQI